MSFLTNMFADTGSFWGDLAKRALPSVMTALFVKKPDINGALAASLPYYQAVADSAAKSNAFADEQAAVFRNRFVPGADQMWAEAQRVGSSADLGQTAGRINADTMRAYDRARQGFDIEARARGVDPTSAAYLAGRGALGATYTPNLVDNLNRGLDSRAQTGFDMRNKALANFNMRPDYSGGANQFNAAARGYSGYADTLNRNYRAEAGDVAEAFKMAQGQTAPQPYSLPPELKSQVDATLAGWRTSRSGTPVNSVQSYDYSLGGSDRQLKAWE